MPDTPVEPKLELAPIRKAGPDLLSDSQRVLDSFATDSETQIRDLLIKEVNAMIRYLVSGGQKIPPEIFAKAEDFTYELKNREREKVRMGAAYQFDPETALKIEDLSTVHAQLSELIAPATPRSILILDPLFASKSRFRWVSNVPLLRRLMFVSLTSLFIFIALATSSYVNEDGGNILTSNGIPLFANLMFFIASAALGATFSALFQANTYMVEGTFNPKYETSYWIRLLVGIMAGLIMACLIPLDEQTLEALHGLGKPALALIGGFSAALVHRILNLFVGAIEGIVKKMTSALIDNNNNTASKKADA